MLTHSHYIASNRFGYGTSPQDIEALAKHSPKDYLIEQLKAYTLPTSSWTSQHAISEFSAFNKARDLAQKNSENASASQEQVGTLRRSLTASARADAESVVRHSVVTSQALQARLLDFFSNHFSVSRNNLFMVMLAPTLEKEAIAPFLHMHFGDMLKSVISHPAMLVYLNNERSIGPNSRRGKRREELGLNENLGREILELHTLGVNGPYKQADVLALATALTGWSIGTPQRKEEAGFLFRKNAHEPGDKTLLNKRYAATKRGDGPQQALTMLDDLAIHPSTAHHISNKLATHFIADTPPKDLVAKMTEMFISSKGHIPSVIKAMIDHPDSWQIAQQKLKTPRDFLISVCRSCELNDPKPSIFQLLEVLGQGLFNAGSPAGYADVTSAWSGPQAMMSRIEWAEHMAKQIKQDVQSLATRSLGPYLQTHTLTQLTRAESQQQAIAMLLMSPEFQRR